MPAGGEADLVWVAKIPIKYPVPENRIGSIELEEPSKMSGNMTCSHGLKQKSWISFAFGGQKTAFLFELFHMMWYTIFCQDS